MAKHIEHFGSNFDLVWLVGERGNGVELNGEGGWEDLGRVSNWGRCCVGSESESECKIVNER